MKSFLLLFLFLLGVIGSAQRANTWIFGHGAGLSFSSTPPSPVNGGQTSAIDNTSAISDQNGNLLFYTNGVNVWNKAHTVMPNGSGLLGHTSAGQCAIIMPLPCQDTKYIIFHTTEFASPGNLSYSVVDMSLQNGMGDVVSTQKNVSLGTGWTEKLCAWYNPAGQFFWLLTHKYGTNEFVAFKVTHNAIATNSVVTQIGATHNCGTYGGLHDAMGQLTISPDGSRVFNAVTCSDIFEIFNFDVTTGALSNAVSLAGDGGGAWGTAFSPDSKKVYTSSLFKGVIHQYDISSGNSTTISNSKTALVTITSGGYHFGYLELGPDDKLYIARPNTTSLSVVNFPNASGTAAGFVDYQQSLGSNTSSHGLSRIAYNTAAMLPATAPTIACNPSTLICIGHSVTLTASGASSYSWSTQSQTHSIVVSPSQTTTYTVSTEGGCGTSTAAVTVVVTECTGLGERIVLQGSSRVYPSPAAGELRIDSSYPLDKATLTILDIAGRRLPARKTEAAGTTAQLDVSDLCGGVYYLIIQTSAGAETVKFVK